MPADPRMMADVLASSGGAGPAPGGEGMPPVAPPSGAPMQPPQTPEEAMMILEQFGITPEVAPIVAQALLLVQQSMGGGGGAPPGPPQGPGGPAPVA